MNDSLQYVKDVAAFVAHLRHERILAESSVTSYERNLYALSRLMAAGVMTDYLHPRFEEVEAVVAAFRNEGGSGTRARAPNSVHQFVATLRTFYRWLAVTERLPVEAIQPVEVISLPRAPNRILPALTVEQVRTLMHSVSPRQRTGARDKAILEVLYSSGCRARELTTLRMADLHFDRGTIRCQGKGGKERMLQLGEEALTALRAYVAFERPFFVRKSEGEVPWLFVLKYGRQLRYRTILDIVRKRSEAAGLPEWIRPHTLRRSCALHLLNGSANVRAVQEFLGHASLNSTQQYLALDEARLQQVHAACHPQGSGAEVSRPPDDWVFRTDTEAVREER